MPIAKMSWVKTPEALEKYLTKNRDAETVETSSHSLEGHMAESIRQEHNRYGDSSKNLAVTIIQSWTKEESKLFSPDDFNQMGMELARRIAPGHMAWVITHTEKEHIHNHIVISAVSSEDGKRLQNKRSFMFKMRDANNEIAREKGLSVIKPRVQGRETNLPEKVKSMVARGKKSWMFDMNQKADFARGVSTSFDEYVAVLKELGVDAHVQNKNISYFYGDNTKAMRGKKLGTRFDKAELIKAFKENDERFTMQPGLRERIRGALSNTFDRQGNRLGTPSDLLLESASYPGLGKKDYSRFTKISRDDARKRLPSGFDVPGSALYEEMKRASKVSILDYCKREGISVTKNADGKSVLRGREFVVLGEFEWKNTKNHTKGTVIDFVALHAETDYLRALAKINNNPRLLLLEPVMGESKRSFQSFYIPKPEKADGKAAAVTLARFANAKGISKTSTEALSKSRNVHVGKNGSVWIFADKERAALEFREAPSGEWKPKRHGDPTSALFENIVKSKRIAVHSDPFDFDAASRRHGRQGSHEESVFVFLDEHSRSGAGKSDDDRRPPKNGDHGQILAKSWYWAQGCDGCSRLHRG